MTTVRSIFDLTSRLVAARLSSALHSRVGVTVASLTQSEWGAFERQLSEHGALLGVELSPYPAQVVCYLPHDLTTAMVDLRLAGHGRGDYGPRRLSDLERRVLAVPFDGLCAAVVDAITPVAPTVSLGRVQQMSGMQGLQFIDAADQCVVVRLSVRLAAGVEHVLFYCAPVATLRPIIETVASQGVRSRELRRPRSAELERLARDIPTRLTLRFPDVDAALGTIRALGVGSVLSLNHPTDEPLVLETGGMPLYRANRVQKGRRLAAQITSRLDADEMQSHSTDEHGQEKPDD